MEQSQSIEQPTLAPSPTANIASAQEIPVAETIEPPKPILETTPENTDWLEVIPKLKLSGLALNAIENAEYIQRDGREIILKIARGHQSLFTPTIVERIENALSTFYQTPIKILLQNESTIQASPAQHKERLTQKKLQSAEMALQNDLVFQQIQQDFSAELVKNSIVPIKDDI